MRTKRPIKITQRISAVTNSFVQSIVPREGLSENELVSLREILGQPAHGPLSCVYCDAEATEWDHLRPLVVARRPSGNRNIFGNLVPSCGPCNHSKGSQDWEKWLQGSAPKSPASRNIADLEQRIAKIRTYASHCDGTAVEVDLYDGDKYAEYWRKLDLIVAQMREAQLLADELRQSAQIKLANNPS